MNFGLGRSNSQFHPELAALPGIGFDARFATHALNDFAHNRQADTRAFVPAGQTFEHAKKTSLSIEGDPDAIIFNADVGDSIRLPDVDLHLRPDARGDKFNGVAQEV